MARVPVVCSLCVAEVTVHVRKTVRDLLIVVRVFVVSTSSTSKHVADVSAETGTLHSAFVAGRC